MTTQPHMDANDLDILTREDLETAAALVAGGRIIEDLPSYEIQKLMTIGQYLTDRGLAEIERRGELVFHGETPTLPYLSEHAIETILTRDGHPSERERN